MIQQPTISLAEAQAVIAAGLAKAREIGWFTTSHIPDMPWFKPDKTTTPSKVWKLQPRAAG